VGPLLEVGEEHGRDRRHAGGGRQRERPVLERRDCLGQGIHRGVPEPRVDVAVRGPGKPCRRFCRIFKDVTGSEKDGFGILAFVRAVLARAHRARVKAPLVDIVGHACCSLNSRLWRGLAENGGN